MRPRTADWGERPARSRMTLQPQNGSALTISTCNLAEGNSPLMTAASLKDYTRSDLAQMAKRKGVTGWHTMRKDQLVSALVKADKRKKSSSTKSQNTSNGKTAPARRSATKTAVTSRSRTQKKNNSRKSKEKVTSKPKTSRTSKQIQNVRAQKERLKDLASNENENNGNLENSLDRIVLMVRGPYWLHACWQLSRTSIQRAQAAMAEQWHTATPILRLLETDAGTTTSISERIIREIKIHGGVRDWYIDVEDPPGSYCVDLGYLTAEDKFYSLARSGVVTTPKPDSSDTMDETWDDVLANCEKVYALSGGYATDCTNNELQDLFEERLKRPMGSPMATRYGVGADRLLGKNHSFAFDVDVEMIIHGSTKPDAYVTLVGEPVTLRPDGTFSVRMNMANRRQVLPLVADSADGLEQRTIVLAIERNTKIMEPVIKDSDV